MLDEYLRPVSHESYLSPEERQRLSERNRGAASHTILPGASDVTAQAEESPRRTRRTKSKSKIRSRRRAHAAPLPPPAEPVRDERAEMLERMAQTEENRRRAHEQYAVPARQPEESSAAAATDDEAEYEDSFDHGSSQAASAARSSFRREPSPRRGWYVVFPFISGSSALQADAEDEPDAQPLPAEDRAYVPETRADAGEFASEAAGRKKVSGSRYNETAGGGYQRRITTGGSIIIGLLTVLLIGCVIYGKVQTNEVYTKIAELQAEYDDINARNISMKSEMEGKLTVKNIEDYAKNTLGLIPLNQSQIEYIQIQTEDEVTITEPEQNLIVTINDYITSFWEFLRGK